MTQGEGRAVVDVVGNPPERTRLPLMRTDDMSRTCTAVSAWLFLIVSSLFAATDWLLSCAWLRFVCVCLGVCVCARLLQHTAYGVCWQGRKRLRFALFVVL